MQWLRQRYRWAHRRLLAGPVGSLLGVLVGHQWDQSKRGARRGSVREISRLFFEATFEIMGQVAKIDGRVSEDEVRVARRIMHGMRLDRRASAKRHRALHARQERRLPARGRLAALAEQVGGRGDLARAFVQIQLQAAIGAGEVGADKRQVLWRVASALGVSRAELAQLEAIVRGLRAQARGAAHAARRASRRLIACSA